MALVLLPWKNATSVTSLINSLCFINCTCDVSMAAYVILPYLGQTTLDFMMSSAPLCLEPQKIHDEIDKKN
jgi:hypothetical protein